MSGPDSATKLRSHAERLRRAFVLDGAPRHGHSGSGALDDVGPALLNGLLAGRLSTHRVVHLASVGHLFGAGSQSFPCSVACT